MIYQSKPVKESNEERLDLIYKKTPQKDLMLTFLPPTLRKYEKAPYIF